MFSIFYKSLNHFCLFHFLCSKRFLISKTLFPPIDEFLRIGNAEHVKVYFEDLVKLDYPNFGNLRKNFFRSQLVRFVAPLEVFFSCDIDFILKTKITINRFWTILNEPISITNNHVCAVAGKQNIIQLNFYFASFSTWFKRQQKNHMFNQYIFFSRLLLR